MALTKTFVQDNGISTSYHKISEVVFSTKIDVDTADAANTAGTDATNELHVGVTSYLNEAYRKAEQPIDTCFYTFEITNEQESELSIRKLAYNQLKTLDEWSDAVDC
jgi:hypothetical protein